MRNLLFIFGLAAILIPRPASASWLYIPFEQLIVEADMVVSGKITDVEQSKGLMIGTITVDKVLKGPKELKTVKIGWDAMPTKNTIPYKKGQDGVWIMNRLRGRECYSCNYPDRYQARDQLARVEKMLKDIEAWKWGKPANGLAIHLSVILGGKHNDDSILIYIKNCTKKTMHVLSHPENRPVKAEIIGPDNKTRIVDFYDWVKKSDLLAIYKGDFHPLPPGKVRCFTMRYRFTYSLASLTQKGEYRITATLTNDEDGKKFKLKDVWTGTAVSNQVVFKKGP
jgi:hypothetical protein